MCGIVGFSARNNITLDQNNIKKNLAILALYNEKRGELGSGYLINNQVVKPKNTSDSLSTLLEQYPLPDIDVKRSSTILLHARKPSAGYNMPNIDNNHPIICEDELYIVHNGTLEFCTSLAKEFNISYNQYTTDSHLAGLCLKRDHMKFLTEYDGTGVFIWGYFNDPDTLYVFKGASLNANGVLEEERPLYYINEPEGIYFSSMSEPLKLIKTTECIFSLKPNNLMTFKAGKGVAMVSVPRNKQKFNKPVRTYGGNYNYNTYNKASSTSPIKTTNKPVTSIQTNINILSEPLPKEAFFNLNMNRLYFHKGRYYEVYHNTQVKNSVLATGELCVNEDGLIVQGGDKYYFYQGVRLRSKSAYKKVMKIHKNNALLPATLSKYSLYPITYQSIVPNAVWYMNGEAIKGEFNFHPIFSSNKYYISKGKLIKIESTPLTNKPNKQLQLPLPLPDTNKKIVLSEDVDYLLCKIDDTFTFLNSLPESVYNWGKSVLDNDPQLKLTLDDAVQQASISNQSLLDVMVDTICNKHTHTKYPSDRDVVEDLLLTGLRKYLNENLSTDDIDIIDKKLLDEEVETTLESACDDVITAMEDLIVASDTLETLGYEGEAYASIITEHVIDLMIALEDKAREYNNVDFLNNLSYQYT